MKVLMVGLDLNPPWVEGIRNTVRDVAVNLLKRGFEVAFFTKDREGLPKVVNGIEYYRVGLGGGSYLSGLGSFAVRAPLTLRRIAKEFDVVHYHSSYLGFGAYMDLITLGLKGISRFFTLYSSYFNRVSGNIPLSLAKSPSLSSPCLRSYLILISRKALSSVRRLGLKVRVKSLPLPLDVSSLKPLKREEAREELGLNADRVILFAGDLSPYKGLEFLLLALRELIKEGVKDFVCLIMNKGLYEKYERRFRYVKELEERLGLKGRLKFLGIVKEVSKVFGAADVIVLPFLSEYPFMDVPRSLLEAMAMARPVIASRVGAIGEVVRDGFNGFTVRPWDVEGLKRNLRSLLEDSKLAERLGLRAREYVKARHDVGKVVDELVKLYEGGN